MIEASFCCFNLSEPAELKIWQSGCLSWNEFSFLPHNILSQKRRFSVNRQIDEAKTALDAGLIDYFLNRFRNSQKIRVFPSFKKHVGYLDIETTGLANSDDIVTIALYTRGRLHIFIRDKNMNEFLRKVRDLSLIVTYNGARFDLPRIRKGFKIDLAIPHLDLLPVLNGLGFKGGLKACEKKLGINRQVKEVQSGAQAPELWRRYSQDKDELSLKRLILYNLQDVLTLEQLLIKAYNLVMSSYPLQIQLPIPSQPNLIDMNYQELFDN